MPEVFKKVRGPKPKGVANRNRGLKWIRQNAIDGVVYFADDDNTYDVRLFNEVNIFIFLVPQPPKLVEFLFFLEKGLIWFCIRILTLSQF